MSWDSTERNLQKGPYTALLVVLVFSTISIVVIGGCSFLLNVASQPAKVLSKTVDADNMIYNYEWFKLRHEGIAAIDRKIADTALTIDSFEASLGPRSEWDREDKEEHARLNSVLLGLRQQRSDLVAEYNAKSRMVNRSIFKAGDYELPERIIE